MKRKIILEVIYISFVILWGYAAFSKLFAYGIFKAQLAKSPLLESIAPAVSIGIPAIEIILAIMLVLDRMKKLGLIGSFVLMMTFTVYLIGMLSFSTDIPCSCGGILQNLTWTQHVYFNIGFVVLSVLGIILQSDKYTNWLERRSVRKFA